MSSSSSIRPTAEVAGELRTAISRLAFHLRESAARSGITPTRLSALAALQRGGPQRPGDLADRLGMSPASMSRLAEALEAGGWVSRRPDPHDQRACLLEVTGYGMRTLDGLRREGTTALARDIDALSPDERASLTAALPVLAALADRHLDAGARTPGR